LGSLPLLGLLIPFLYLHGPDEVAVVLERGSDKEVISR